MAQLELNDLRKEYHNLLNNMGINPKQKTKKLKKLESKIIDMNNRAEIIDSGIKRFIELSPNLKHVKSSSRKKFFNESPVGSKFDVLSEINQKLSSEGTTLEIFVKSVDNVDSNSRALGGTAIQEKGGKYYGQIEININKSMNDFATYSNEMGDVYNLIVNKGSDWAIADSTRRAEFDKDHIKPTVDFGNVYGNARDEMYQQLNATELSSYIEKVVKKSNSSK
jgi:hypothetical protein